MASRTQTTLSAGPAFIAAVLMLGLLGIQYLLGMYVNFYVHLSQPVHGNGRAMMTMFGGDGGWFMVHMFLGLALALGSIVTLAMAARAGNKALIMAVVAALGIFVGGTGGMLFIMGNQTDGWSFLMAVGFIVSTLSYTAVAVLVLVGATSISGVDGNRAS